jgi:hypothetical protein
MLKMVWRNAVESGEVPLVVYRFIKAPSIYNLKYNAPSGLAKMY